MSSDGDDYGTNEGNGLFEASPVLPTFRDGRTQKRQKLGHSRESGNAIARSSDDHGYQRQRQTSMSNDSVDLDTDDDISEPVSYRRNATSRSTSAALDHEGIRVEAKKAEKKKKPKHLIRIPTNIDCPSTEVQYATQPPENLEDPDSSPSRIRGARWMFKKPDYPVSTTSKSRPITTSSSFQRSSSTNAPTPRGQAQTTSNSRQKSFSPAERLATFASIVPCERPTSSVTQPVDVFTDEPARSKAPHEVDLAYELEGLNSDDFASSPEPGPEDGRVITIDDYELSPVRTLQRLAAPQNNLRQITLFGSEASTGEEPPSQLNKVRNYLADRPTEKPTHHELDLEALKTWLYPTNLGKIRDYQYSIVSNALFNNTLVALPTGLGKTFIAATVMLNFFRWTKKAKIVFMAPTKPLAAQQIDACFTIAGIPRSMTTLLTGEVSPALRTEEWLEKRVFFVTPQTLQNDLSHGVCEPRDIVLLVVDEAHRATGNYAYTKVIEQMRRFNQDFRVLALTATPGSSVEAVQDVIDNLSISKVEIRTEESIDIRPFVHRRDVDEIVLDPSDEMVMIQGLISRSAQSLLNILCQQKAYYNNDVMSLTLFGVRQTTAAWAHSDAGRRAPMGLKGLVQSAAQLLMSVAHAIKMLNFHGMGPFFVKMKDIRREVEEKGSKGGKLKRQLVEHADFKTMMDRLQLWINRDDFVGHPKLTWLLDTLLNHFIDAGEGRLGEDSPPSSTRAIVFSEYRESAEEICRVLNRHGPMIRASVFVGQADTKTSAGMNQDKQQKTINDFKKGVFNVIVATSIGEEGLDIGQVDLIICYDSSQSPIRMLQRMGRTGRKRVGKVVLLLMKGKEVDSFAKAKDGYEKIQKMICEGTRFNFRDDLSRRIVPRDIRPVPDKRDVEIPVENTQDSSLPEPKKGRGRAKKKPPKKFHVPDGVEMGIVSAANLMGRKKSKAVEDPREVSELDADQLTPVPALGSVLLDRKEMAELEHRYLNVPEGELQEVGAPEMTLHPSYQRNFSKTRRVKHGSVTKRFVGMLRNMHQMAEGKTEQWSRLFHLHGFTPAPADFICNSPSPPQRKQAMQVLSDDDEQTLPLRKAVKPRKKAASRKRKKAALLSEGESVDNSADELFSNNEEMASDLIDFIAQDDEIVYDNDLSPLSSSPPVIISTPKPREVVTSKLFFEPTQFTATQDTNNDDEDDDEMPDIGALVGHDSGKKRTPPFVETWRDKAGETSKDLVQGKSRVKRRRRAVVEDSDDE